MAKYMEFGGGLGSAGDTPCVCKECECETFDACNWPYDNNCACKGSCCDTTNLNDNPLLMKEKELIDARLKSSMR